MRNAFCGPNFKKTHETPSFLESLIFYNENSNKKGNILMLHATFIEIIFNAALLEDHGKKIDFPFISLIAKDFF